MSNETILLLHRGCKTAVLLWWALRRYGYPAAWFLTIAMGMAIAVLCLCWVRMQMARMVSPWPR